MVKVEHRGYVIMQSGDNYHFMIGKDDRVILHAHCDRWPSEDELREKVDNFIVLQELLFPEESRQPLPCEPGSTVYIVGGPKYRGGRSEYWINTTKFRPSDLEKWGDTVFGTKEDAEAKLQLLAEQDSRFKRT